MKIWLDDVRPLPDSTWTLVKNYEQFVFLMERVRTESVTDMSLDHDLGEGCEKCWPVNEDGETIILSVCDHLPRCKCICHKTGQDVVQWMVDNRKFPENPPRVHSANYHGRLRMEAMIRDYYSGAYNEGGCLEL